MPPPKAFRSLRQTMEAKNVGKSKGSCCKTFARILFSHVGLLVLVTIYAVLGAYLFIWLELDAEDARRENKRRVYDNMAGSLSYIVDLFWYKNKQNLTRTEFHAMIQVPITVNLCVIFVYLLAGGVLFSWWEGWRQIQSVYFTFITLTTIGFGDLVPGNSFLDLSDGLMAAFKMAVTVAYCLFGMALLSMCINLMQEQLVLKTRLMLTELGIMEEEIDPMEKYKYTKSQRGTVLETDRDHDGNKRLSLLNINEGESTSRAPTSTSASYYRDNNRRPPSRISIIREEGGV
ncbi:hypothetical protein Pmani_020680 [Petrolisthes manimaculis]|uniref:Potassium channel domain-containing protein n=1 Tax=Petrolisthes manimaculis TaxID=1843537 RepID=A0AAE1U2B5_9EUCA|nr:hypothetical protein Pmani_020680 [Petrolisthes manimaculis]